MHRRSSLLIVSALLILVAFASIAQAKVKLPSIISDNMVLQQGRPVIIWGWAEPGEGIKVELYGGLFDVSPEDADGDWVMVMRTRTAKTKADESGRWQVTFDALKPDKYWHRLTIEDASGEMTSIDNILVGEVWLCSGQSNMEWPVARVNNAGKEIAAARYPKIRFFQVRNRMASKPQRDCQGRWVECSPEMVAGHTAVGYFFGRELFKELKVPIGLIESDWGGSPAEAWTSSEALEAQRLLKPLLKRWEKAGKSKQQHGKSHHCPTRLYNAMVAPLLPYAIRGAIWYQGETNVPRAHQYRTIFPTMIADWREGFKQPKLPFGFVQIAPFAYSLKDNKKDPHWCPELWEAQRLTLKSVPDTGMVVTTDIGNPADIHPKNKQDVGHRLALWALATVYGKDLVYSGPIYRSMKVEGDKIRLSFDHVGGGLASRDGKPLTHFTIAGADQEFYPAMARIEGDTIVIASDAVKRPVAVRFASDETAEPNLTNKEGLPASPFRTDDWKWLTEGKH